MGIYFVLRRNFILEGTNWLFKDMVTSLCAISDGLMRDDIWGSERQDKAERWDKTEMKKQRHETEIQSREMRQGDNREMR